MHLPILPNDHQQFFISSHTVAAEEMLVDTEWIPIYQMISERSHS